MSTRSNVLIRSQGQQVVLYHHWDGYPKGFGKELCEVLLPEFQREPKYILIEDVVNKLIMRHSCEWTTNLHGDIEYLYTVDLDRRTITCEGVNNWGDRLEVKDSIDMIATYKTWEK